MRISLLVFISNFIAIAFLSNEKIYSQVAAYSFTQSNASYVPIFGSTVLSTATSNTANGSIGGMLFQNQALEFPFFYNGINYTAVNVSSDGFISFGNHALSTSQPISSLDLAYEGAIAAWGREINGVFDVDFQTSDIRMETVGIAPNRETVIQWTNFRPAFSTSLDDAYTFSFQIRLLETSNIVKVIYGTGGYTTGVAGVAIGGSVFTGPQVGLRGASNADFNNRTGSSWLTSNPGMLNTNSMAFSTTDN